MLALTLGSSVVTLLPKPAAGASRESVREAVDQAPRYLRLMESWRWSGPLWDADVISSVIDDDDSAAELARVYESIRNQDELSSLRPLTRSAEEKAAKPFRALDALADDLLRGGPDPGINIPITAALDRFALRHRLCVVRATTASIAQRAEARLGKRVCAFSLPMLIRAGGGRILRLRSELAGPLERLRSALVEAGAAAVASDGCAPASVIEETGAACAEFAKAFGEWAPDNARGDDENDQRVTAGYLGVSVVVMPADAALRSSRAAVRAIGVGGADEGPTGPCPDRLFALVVREMNVRPG